MLATLIASAVVVVGTLLPAAVDCGWQPSSPPPPTPRAVMTTVGRALGIPSRPVTTFQSAHDADRNRAIDKFYAVGEGGAFDPTDGPDGAHDSVWSFHVWTEYWFDRPTLGAKVRDD